MKYERNKMFRFCLCLLKKKQSMFFHSFAQLLSVTNTVTRDRNRDS